MSKGLNTLIVNINSSDVISKVNSRLIDAGKIFFDAFQSRKYHIEANLNPTVKKIVRESKTDKLLW